MIAFLLELKLLIGSFKNITIRNSFIDVQHILAVFCQEIEINLRQNEINLSKMSDFTDG